jgi:hypothetical protein
MPENHIHIVSFDIPWPPNYGGVIDVFYKVRTLHRLGIKIHLHCYEYPGRDRALALNEFCEEVLYYPRKTGMMSALSFKPYIVSSRRSEELMANLLKDNHPIIFEGLHSCYYIDDPRLTGRMKVYRESNIEHSYYFNLFKVDPNPFRKIYFLMASLKLRLYQKVLRKANLMLAVSKHDSDYLAGKFPGCKVVYLPSFHINDKVTAPPGRGEYALYHGNIEVPENEYAAKFLVNEVFNKPGIQFIIAGMKPRDIFYKLEESNPSVKLVANPSDEEMFSLIRNAHVNILVTFQATGLKLKLLNTLYQGRFCLVNDAMIKGTGLDGLCEVGNTPGELRTKLEELFNKDFDEKENVKRQRILLENYDNLFNGKRLIELVFNR